MDDFLSGFPPPPFFYLNYRLRDSSPEESLDAKFARLQQQINDARGTIFDYQKLKCFEGPPPPAPPKDSWYSFGAQERVGGADAQFGEESQTLDSETLIPPAPGSEDLRQHFRLLYAQFTDSLVAYLDHIKNVGPP